MERSLLVPYALVWITLALRAAALGEKLDVALHRIDPGYRNQRDMARDIASEPIAAGRAIPTTFGRFAKRLIVRLGDAGAERSRTQTVRAYLLLAAFTVVGLTFLLVVSKFPGISGMPARGAVALFELWVGVYWTRGLLIEFHRVSRSSYLVAYAACGVLASAVAVAATIQGWGL